MIFCCLNFNHLRNLCRNSPFKSFVPCVFAPLREIFASKINYSSYYMFSSSRIWVVVIVFFLTGSCKTNSGKDKQLLFWCSNNPQEIQFSTARTKAWNSIHNTDAIRQQPIPEGQSSEEVILAAVVGKTTPDIYANMWQGNVEMFAHAGVLIALDKLNGFEEFIRERCDSAAIK